MDSGEFGDSRGRRRFFVRCSQSYDAGTAASSRCLKTRNIASPLLQQEFTRAAEAREGASKKEVLLFACRDLQTFDSQRKLVNGPLRTSYRAGRKIEPGLVDKEKGYKIRRCSWSYVARVHVFAVHPAGMIFPRAVSFFARILTAVKDGLLHKFISSAKLIYYRTICDNGNREGGQNPAGTSCPWW